MSSDDELVTAARRGSTEAVEVLFGSYWLTAWRAAYAVCGRPEVADDAAQDAFVTAVRTLERFELGRPFAPWIARIAVNRARDLMRAEHRQERLRVPHLDTGSARPEGDRANEVLVAVEALPPERREVAVLHHVLAFTFAEIAAILDLPVGTVASRSSRAVSELRQTLEAMHNA